MVKYKKIELARQVKGKLALRGKTIVQFCRNIGVSYSLYKDFIDGKAIGTRVDGVKTQRLIKAIEKILGREREVTRRDKVTR